MGHTREAGSCRVYDGIACSPKHLHHIERRLRQFPKMQPMWVQLFAEVAWQQVCIGQGLIPEDYNNIVDSLSSEQLNDLFSTLKTLITSTVDQLPTHKDFLAKIKKA